jgi:hypothetical protein
MASQGTSAGGLTKFAVFPKLPKELKLMIWKKALPGPRVVELEYHQNDNDGDGDGDGDDDGDDDDDDDDDGNDDDNDGEFIMQGHFTSPCPIPVILSVCQESRTEAQNQYELSFPSIGSGPKVYFNPSIDTLVLSWRGAFTNAAIAAARNDIFGKVEHICFASWEFGYALALLDNLDHIDAYPSAKTITVASDFYGPGEGLDQPSIEEDEFTMDEQSLCAAKIDDFLMRFVERHPNRTVPTVLVRSINRHE